MEILFACICFHEMFCFLNETSTKFFPFCKMDQSSWKFHETLWTSTKSNLLNHIFQTTLKYSLQHKTIRTSKRNWKKYMTKEMQNDWKRREPNICGKYIQPAQIKFLFSYFKRNEIFKDLWMLRKYRFRIYTQIERMECWHAWKIGFISSKTKSSGDHFRIVIVTGWIFRFFKDETFWNYSTRWNETCIDERKNHMTNSNKKMNWMVAMKNHDRKQIRKFRENDFAVGSWSMENGQTLTKIGSGSRY